MAFYVNGVEVGRIIFMKRVPLQKPKNVNRKRRREIAKAMGKLPTKKPN